MKRKLIFSPFRTCRVHLGVNLQLGGSLGSFTVIPSIRTKTEVLAYFNKSKSFTFTYDCMQ